MNNCLNGVINLTGQAIPRGKPCAENGLLYCKNCIIPRQYAVILFGQRCLMPVVRRCLEEETAADKRKAKQQARSAEISCLRNLYLGTLISWSRRNRERFGRLYCENIGAIFTSAVYNGETFAVVCVADAHVDGGVPVRRYALPRLLTDLQIRWEKSELLDRLASCSLLVLDDLGCERDSECALKPLFSVINTRCRTGKSLIMTINLTADKLKEPMNLRYERLYNRIAELCVTVAASDHSCRKVRRIKRQRALALLGEEEES